jgi:hypothetical protein
VGRVRGQALPRAPSRRLLVVWTNGSGLALGRCRGGARGAAFAEISSLDAPRHPRVTGEGSRRVSSAGGSGRQDVPEPDQCGAEGSFVFGADGEVPLADEFA